MKNNIYHRNGTVTTWNVFSQNWVTGYPSDFSDRIWASQTEEVREKWNQHEKKYRN